MHFNLVFILYELRRFKYLSICFVLTLFLFLFFFFFFLQRQRHRQIISLLKVFSYIDFFLKVSITAANTSVEIGSSCLSHQFIGT